MGSAFLGITPQTSFENPVCVRCWSAGDLKSNTPLALLLVGRQTWRQMGTLHGGGLRICWGEQGGHGKSSGLNLWECCILNVAHQPGVMGIRFSCSVNVIFSMSWTASLIVSNFPSLPELTVALATLNPALLKHAWSVCLGELAPYILCQHFSFISVLPLKKSKNKMRQVFLNQVAVVSRAGCFLKADHIKLAADRKTLDPGLVPSAWSGALLALSLGAHTGFWRALYLNHLWLDRRMKLLLAIFELFIEIMAMEGKSPNHLLGEFIFVFHSSWRKQGRKKSPYWALLKSLMCCINNLDFLQF